MQNTELAIRPQERPGEMPSKTAGDYEFAYRIEPASGLYEFSAGKLEWKEPQDENVHVDLFVSDAQDGRDVPGLNVSATILDAKGGRAAAAHLPFVWHPERNHYGANVKIPQSGEYMLQVHVHPATFTRAGKEAGKRYVADVDVQFEGVRIDV